jgi:hypothetical protein
MVLNIVGFGLFVLVRLLVLHGCDSFVSVVFDFDFDLKYGLAMLIFGWLRT